MILQPLPYTGNNPRVVAREIYNDKNSARNTAARRNKLYAAVLNCAADPTSELFHRDSRTGILYRRTGAAHRCGFWAGYDAARTGIDNRLARGHASSDVAVCYRAGRDFGRYDLKGTTP